MKPFVNSIILPSPIEEIPVEIVSRTPSFTLTAKEMIWGQNWTKKRLISHSSPNRKIKKGKKVLLRGAKLKGPLQKYECLQKVRLDQNSNQIYDDGLAFDSKMLTFMSIELNSSRNTKFRSIFWRFESQVLIYLRWYKAIRSQSPNEDKRRLTCSEHPNRECFLVLSLALKTTNCQYTWVYLVIDDLKAHICS